MEGHGFFVGLDLEMLHGRPQALAFLGIADHFAKQPLNIIDSGQPGFAFIESHVLAEHGDVVASPGEQHVILAAPGGKRGHGFIEGGRFVQLLLGDVGDPLNPRMQLHVLLRPNQLAEGINHLHLIVHLHGADLDHFKKQLAAHAFIGGGIIGHGLIPFQVQHDILHGRKHLEITIQQREQRYAAALCPASAPVAKAICRL